MTPDELRLIERAVSAHRDRTPDGQIQSSAAWHDSSDEGRREVFAETVRQRAVERSLDADGLSATVKAVLARITSG